VGTLEEQDLFSSRAEEVQQSLRFVKYNLGQSSMTDTQELLATLDTNNTAADVPLVRHFIQKTQTHISRPLGKDTRLAPSRHAGAHLPSVCLCLL
jgi:hypothetical protein